MFFFELIAMEKYIDMACIKALWAKIKRTFLSRVIGDYVILTRDGNELTGDTPGAGEGTIIVQFSDGPRLKLTGKKGTGYVEMGSDQRGGFLSLVYDGKEVLRAGKEGVMVSGNYTDESGITFQRMGRLVTLDLNKAEELGLLKDKGAADA